MGQIELYKSFNELLDPYIGRIYRDRTDKTALYSVNRVGKHSLSRKHYIFLDVVDKDLEFLIWADHTSHSIPNFFQCLKDRTLIDTGKRKIFSH